MNEQAAISIAQSALLWLVSDAEILPIFLGASGVDLAAIRARQNDNEFLGFVLDFILMNDEWVIGAAAKAAIEPGRIWHARQALPGGADPHWT